MKASTDCKGDNVVKTATDALSINGAVSNVTHPALVGCHLATRTPDRLPHAATRVGSTDMARPPHDTTASVSSGSDNNRPQASMITSIPTRDPTSCCLARVYIFARREY